MDQFKNRTSMIMKNQLSFFIVVVLLSLTSCEKDKMESTNNLGTLIGTIGLYEGNCMPPVICDPSPISATIAITKPSENFNIHLLVDSITTYEDGTFEISLPEGKYSLFLRDGSTFICDRWICSDVCFCSLITIKGDSVTTVSANIDHAYW